MDRVTPELLEALTIIGDGWRELLRYKNAVHAAPAGWTLRRLVARALAFAAAHIEFESA